MNRRDFLVKASAVMAVAGATRATLNALGNEIPPDVPDRFQLAEWDIAWSGWKEPINQNIIVGYWFARSSRHERGWASCTMGATHEYRELECLIATYSSEHGAVITCFSTDADREMAKRNALKRLLVSLKTGQPFGRVYGWQ